MKKFNINESIWFLILSSFSYYIYMLFKTGDINLYIHPKMFKYVLFSLGVFILLSIFQIRKIFNYSKVEKIKIGYIMFLVPLLMGFVINPDTLTGKIVSNKQVDIVNSNLNNTEKSSINDEYNMNDQYTYYDEDAEKFKCVLIDLYGNLDKMIGQEVEVSGFVYRQSDFPKNRFVISRLVISCCAADASVEGFLCEWGNTKKLKENEWIKITGIVDCTNHNNEYTSQDEIIPLIRISKIERIEPPKSQYIYP